VLSQYPVHVRSVVYTGRQGAQWTVLAASEAACSRRAWAVVPPIAKPMRSAESVGEPGEGRLAWVELVLSSGVASVLDLLGEASAESIAVTGKAAEILNVIS
jgi:hypothetical protein